MKNRRERRAEARENKTTFEPQYTSGIRKDKKGNEYIVGGNPRTTEEVTGVGYERFNNKFVTIKEVETAEVETEDKAE